MSQLYRLFTVWNSDLFSIWFFGHLPFFWATLLKFRTTWLRFQATWFWARWLSSDLIDFLQSFPPNISRWWSHMIPQGHPQLSFQGSSLLPTRHMITPLYVMSMTYYLHMISEQFWKKVACGVDEWVMRYIIKTGEEQGQFPSRSPEWLTTNNRIFVGHAVHTVIWDRFNATFNVNVKTDVLFR